MRYSARIELGKEKNPSQNLVVGALHTASAIFIAGYDTTTVSLLPSYKYYPLNSEKNAKNDLINFVLKCILSVILLLADLLLLNRLPFMAENATAKVVLNVVVVILLYFIMNGVASSYNYNRNTAALVLLYKVAEKWVIIRK